MGVSILLEKMPKPVRKAILPAAGLGTRFLPFTKAVPKEMLPIIDKPVIQYLVEEAVSAGIEEIIIVTGPGKVALEEHFNRSEALEEALQRKGKIDILHDIEEIPKLATFHYVLQEKPLGDGHAILCAKELIKEGEAFAVLFGDDVIHSEIPAIGQLIDAYEKTGNMIIGVQEIEEKDISKYGVVDPKILSEDFYFPLQGMVEKPTIKEAPSLYGIVGKYVCTSEIFHAIEHAEKSRDGELRLIDGFRQILKKDEIYARILEGTRYDMGSKIGYLKATIDFALQNPRYAEEIRNHLKNKGK